jgi:hypothetical protein
MKRIVTFVAAVTSAAAFGYGCSSSDNGSASDAGASEAAAIDSPVSHRDSSPITTDDAGGDDGPAATTCPTPADVSSWPAPALHTPKTSTSACTAKDIADYDAACLNTATRTMADCTAFGSSRATCQACIESTSTDTTWGPLVAFSGVVNINLGGCLALVDPQSASCGRKVQDYDECVHAACDGVCPVTSTATFALWEQCQMTATAQGCGMYSTAAQCIGLDDAGTICSAAGGFDAAFLAIAPLFCGGASEAGTTEAGPPVEAGATEAGPDAAAD